MNNQDDGNVYIIIEQNSFIRNAEILTKADALLKKCLFFLTNEVVNGLFFS